MNECGKCLFYKIIKKKKKDFLEKFSSENNIYIKIKKKHFKPNKQSRQTTHTHIKTLFKILFVIKTQKDRTFYHHNDYQLRDKLPHRAPHDRGEKCFDLKHSIDFLTRSFSLDCW